MAVKIEEKHDNEGANLGSTTEHRFRLAKSVLIWSADFYNKQRSFTVLLLVILGGYLLFKSAGFTPLKIINRLIHSTTVGRKWTKICSYGLYTDLKIDTSLNVTDIDDILADIATTDCDFYVLDSELTDAQRDKIKISGVEVSRYRSK